MGVAAAHCPATPADRLADTDVVIWTPVSQEELQTALSTGMLKESHTLDLKRELGLGDSAKRDFAKDIWPAVRYPH